MRTTAWAVAGWWVAFAILVGGCSGDGANEGRGLAPRAPSSEVLEVPGVDGAPDSAVKEAREHWADADRARERPDLFGPTGFFNRRPHFVAGEVRRTEYDGGGDDLLTAGLGMAGLAGVPPPFTDPLAPTAAELRRAAIYYSHRALLDMTAAGGYGTLYGPNVAADGTVTTGDGKVAGTEALAFSDDGSGSRNVVLMVQIPAGFDPRRPCIVTATSSGSRGIYGAITTGEWGLKRGCAVAYTDKGTGSAPHDLAGDTVALIDGTRVPAAVAGDTAHFRAPLSAEALAAVAAARPGRFAFKHAHSRQNPEKDWGRSTLEAIEFAFWLLNERHGRRVDHDLVLRTINPRNTMVIASSISNGGGAAIAAAELDRAGLIDGVAVSEPAIEMPRAETVVVRRGGVTRAVNGRTLYDFTTWAQLFQSCASLSPRLTAAPGLAFVVPAIAANRCASLKDKGLLAAATLSAQADEALDQFTRYGWEPEAAILQPSMAAFEVAPAVAVTFGNALARASVADPLCGYSFAATTPTGSVTSIDPAALAAMAATGNGIPPASGVQLVNDRHPGGPLRDLLSVSASTGRADGNLDGAVCLRALLTTDDAAARALRAGLDETRRSGDLRGKPTLIVHGRDDALLPVSHTSRPYAALNRRVERGASRLSYIEVTNAQHFDGFIGVPAVLPGYDARYVPLHVYLNRALDAMAAHLDDGRPLPPSQVVRTVPRGGPAGAAPPIAAANLPPIADAPATGDRITIGAGVIDVPD